MLKPLIDKNEFIGLDTCTWLYSGAESPPLRESMKQADDYFLFRAQGPAGRQQNAEIELACKQKLATLLHGEAEQIALMSNASEAISSIAASLDLKEGDNVVIHTLEFPSGVLPWLSLKEKKVEVRVVAHNNWEITVDDVMQHVDTRTRIVITSHVSYLSGTRLDYKALYSRLKQSETLLLLDATQSLGVIPVDINEADFIVSSSYKWLLGIHGLGILAINPKRTARLMPLAAGWRAVADMPMPDRFHTMQFWPDARRFELGFPSYAAIYALNYSLSRLLEIGVDTIAAHVISLGEKMIDGFKAAGFEVMTPSLPDHRAGNICASCEEGEGLADELQQSGIYVMGGDGRIRASIHLFNDLKDITHLTTLLCERASILGQISRG